MWYFIHLNVPCKAISVKMRVYLEHKLHQQKFTFIHRDCALTGFCFANYLVFGIFKIPKAILEFEKLSRNNVLERLDTDWLLRISLKYT